MIIIWYHYYHSIFSIYDYLWLSAYINGTNIISMYYIRTTITYDYSHMIVMIIITYLLLPMIISRPDRGWPRRRTALCCDAAMMYCSDTANFQTKTLYIWSLGQTHSYIKEVGFLSAPSNFLAQWFRNFDSTILGLTILSVTNSSIY